MADYSRMDHAAAELSRRYDAAADQLDAAQQRLRDAIAEEASARAAWTEARNAMRAHFDVPPVHVPVAGISLITTTSCNCNGTGPNGEHCGCDCGFCRAA